MALTRIKRDNISPDTIDFDLLDVPGGQAGQALTTDGSGNLEFVTLDDPLVIRGVVGPGQTTATIGQLTNRSGKTYFISKVTITVTNGFSGNGVDHAVIKDSANTLFVTDSDADILTVGTYVVEQDWLSEAVPGSIITVEYRNSAESPVVPTAGQATIAVEYRTLTT